jgi:glycosyltransferase involved in cell wall biosynthesis
MKIAHVIHAFPPFSRAGSENYCYTLAAEEARRHEVSVFHRIADPERPEYEVTEDRVGSLPVVRTNRTFRDVQSFDGTYRSEPVAAAFGKFLDRVRPDLIHFHHVTCLSTTCVHEAKARGISIVYTLHDFWLLCPRGQLLRRDLSLCETHTDADCVRCMAYQLRLSGGHAQMQALSEWAAWLKRFRLPKELYGRLASRPFRNETAAIEQVRTRTAHILEMCALVDRFVSPSRFLRERYVEFGIPAEKIAVHDYGFDTGGWTRGARGPTAAGPLRVVYLGTWIPSKGVHVLLEAFRELDPARAILNVYGYAVPYDGVENYEGQLRQLAGHAPHIRFPGAYTSDEVPRMLADADVVVVPSIWYENSPLTIHEAFLAGVPVVTAGHGGMAELVKDQVSGLTFQAGNPASLRRALRRLIENRGLLENLRANIPTVKSIEDNAKELDAIYHAVRS